MKWCHAVIKNECQTFSEMKGLDSDLSNGLGTCFTGGGLRFFLDIGCEMGIPQLLSQTEVLTIGNAVAIKGTKNNAYCGYWEHMKTK